MHGCKEIAKCIGVILGYLILWKATMLLEFWFFMSKIPAEQLSSGQWSWIDMPESRIFYAPCGTGLLRAVIIAILLCVMTHGKDLRLQNFQLIWETIAIRWKRILGQGIVITGVCLGMAYARILDRISSVISAKDIYFFFSGTTVLKDMNGIDNIAEIFYVLTGWKEPDLWMMPIVFLIYEMLRVVFDRKMGTCQ